MKFYEKNKSTYCGFLKFLNWFHEYFLQATEAHIFYWKNAKKILSHIYVIYYYIYYIYYLYVKCILFIESLLNSILDVIGKDSFRIIFVSTTLQIFLSI